MRKITGLIIKVTVGFDVKYEIFQASLNRQLVKQTVFND
jgi:hypothetical protein